MTLEDLVDSTRRLADSNFATAAAINKLVPAFEQLRRDIYDIKADREMDQAKIDLAIGRVSTDLARLLDGVARAQTDVRELQRDVTGAHLLPPREPRKSKIVETIEAFERLRPLTKILVLLALIAAAASGWLTHLLAG